MLRLIFCIPLFWLISCSSNNKIKNNDIEFIIQESQSYKYDLRQHTYTVFNMHGATTIHFNLSKNEKEQIVNEYYKLGLDNIHNDIKIEDVYNIMPKLYTTLLVRLNDKTHSILIDDACSDYKFALDNYAQKIKIFLQFIYSVLKEKPEIKNAPISDIMYL